MPTKKKKKGWQQLLGKQVIEDGIDLEFLVFEDPSRHPDGNNKYKCGNCGWEKVPFLEYCISTLVFHYDRCPERLKKLRPKFPEFPESPKFPDFPPTLRERLLKF